jgi:GDP/UDP-N,N'-diacetylbacillosamine 2-epimerase (hydrolysing)
LTQRRIVYVTGTRADFGLMRRTLERLHHDPEVALSVLVTGMHLDPAYGMTADEVRAAGFSVLAEVPVPLKPTTGATMARNIGRALLGFVDALYGTDAQILLLLGDRGEMLAGAIAGAHLGMVVAHVHGGERSGTVDEPVRHAISKLAHVHLAATEASRARLVRMGEAEAHVHCVGAPGLDGIQDGRAHRDAVLSARGLDPARPCALLLFHPVLQEAARARRDTELILTALFNAQLQVLALRPNADAGGESVAAALAAAEGRPGFRLVTHLPRPDFLSAMATADLMIGNSSAGIIEAASFGTPVINIGSRQNLRERNANVSDIDCEPEAIAASVAAALARGRFAPQNIYGDGRAAERICAILKRVAVDGALLHKVNGY